ncbi:MULTISPECIES: hypothetical protein [unclassified Streptomyces]|uniref:hypothetical protein n=1 Tax=unclassified Streptomyces TaxID=2593676 RepID=UPI0037B6AEF6
MHDDSGPDRPVSHLLIESQGGGPGDMGSRFIEDAAQLARSGHPVQLLLIQNGVVAAAGDDSPAQSLVDAGGELWVDSFSLAQRGMASARLLRAAQTVEMPEISARLLDPGVRVVWH